MQSGPVFRKSVEASWAFDEEILSLQLRRSQLVSSVLVQQMTITSLRVIIKQEESNVIKL